MGARDDDATTTGRTPSTGSLRRDGIVPDELLAGRYTIRKILGRGGMGIVVAAWDETSQREVAVKLLNPRLQEATSVERFFREARSTSKITSDHVVKIYDVGVDQERPFIVMEHLEGEDLGARLRRTGVFTSVNAADAVIASCAALAYAHGVGIVHRDIKPSNLFAQTRADSTEILKVLDFGISKSVLHEDGEATLTQTGDGGLLGSPPYMSPEQLRNPRAVDHRSDYWALGVVLYRLLSGKFPFDGESVGEVFVRIMERKYPSLAEHGLVIPSGLDTVIERCLAHERSQRFQNAGELAHALIPFSSLKGRALAAQVIEITKRTPPKFKIDIEELAPTASPRRSQAPKAVQQELTPPSLSPKSSYAYGEGSDVPIAVDVPAFGAAKHKRLAAIAIACALVVLAVLVLIVYVRGNASTQDEFASAPPRVSVMPERVEPSPRQTASTQAVALGMPASSLSAKAQTSTSSRPIAHKTPPPVTPLQVKPKTSAELHPNPYGNE
jgi:serine/threonine protein kinase